MNDEEFDDIAPVVLAAARTLTPYQHDLQGVRRRGTMRRRKRMIGASVITAVVTMATAVTVSAALPRVTVAPEEAVQAVPSATPSPPPAMAQVLFINAYGHLRTESTTDAGIIGYAGIMRADGSFKDYPGVPGLDTQELVPMSGGGWVLRGLIDLAPGVSREDGPCVSHIATPLVVLDADGTQLSHREIHRQCHPAYLVGVHAGRAFLARDNDFVTIDLATGTESVFAPLGSSLPARSGIEGGVLYSLTEQAGGCPKLTLRTIDIATGADTSRELTPPACGFGPERLRLSPDGSRIAFTYTTLAETPSTATSVVIADTATGQILSSQVLPRSHSSRVGTIVGGMAWVDAGTVRVAYAVPPAEGVHKFREIVQTIDIG